MADQSEGPATDRHNEPVIDPTENVKALNEAQNLLREMESGHVREILALRSDHAEKIGRLEALLSNEKFVSVARVQALTESHRIELKDDSGKALTAALAAAEKAVAEQNKSATLSTDRAVAQMKELIINNYQIAQATTNALGDKVEDLKAQVSILVNQRIGAGEQKTEQRAVGAEQRGITGATLAAIGIVLTVVAIAAPIIITLALR